MPSFQGDVAGESISTPLKVGFDRRLKLQFHGAKLSSDGGLIVFRELDEVLGLTRMASWELCDGRTGKNRRHDQVAMLRQSVFGRIAGYEDVNDAGRLARDPVMRLITGQRGFDRFAALESQMGRFETSTLTAFKNLAALADLSGKWIDLAPKALFTASRKPRLIMVTSAVAAIIRCSSSTSTVTLNAVLCVLATFTARTIGKPCSTQ